MVCVQMRNYCVVCRVWTQLINGRAFTACQPLMIATFLFACVWLIIMYNISF
jgi:hypothetical protein